MDKITSQGRPDLINILTSATTGGHKSQPELGDADRGATERTLSNNGDTSKSSLSATILILMDAQMPKLTGIDATREIRNMDEPYRSLPVIGLTAHTQEADKLALIDAGMNECFSKPMETADLDKTLRLYLSSPDAG